VVLHQREPLEYASRLASRDAPVVQAMRELASQYPRYGYRKIRIFLARRGHAAGGRTSSHVRSAA
jgi:putative transposase